MIKFLYLDINCNKFPLCKFKKQINKLNLSKYINAVIYKNNFVGSS